MSIFWYFIKNLFFTYSEFKGFNFYSDILTIFVFFYEFYRPVSSCWNMFLFLFSSEGRWTSGRLILWMTLQLGCLKMLSRGVVTCFLRSNLSFFIIFLYACFTNDQMLSHLRYFSRQFQSQLVLSCVIFGIEIVRKACILNVTEELSIQIKLYWILLSFSLIFLRRLLFILRYYLSQFVKMLKSQLGCKKGRCYIMDRFKLYKNVNQKKNKGLLCDLYLFFSLYSLLIFELLSMRHSLSFPMRMIDFVSDLYKNYKVLNKLGEKESLEFQREVVTALVDSKQNVDRQIFQQMLQDDNMEVFILQLLGKVINRNPFKNQFEMNRNLATITQNLKKEQEELQKKQKILERKEEKLKMAEEGLINTIKQKIQSFQNESIQKIIKKQTEIKKNITNLINQLKSKEKLIIQRYQQSKVNTKLLQRIEQKEKMVNQKLKNIEKREKELKSKENQTEGMKKEAQLQQYKQQVQKLREAQRQAIKRYKNLQLAYKKIKNEKNKPESSQKIQQIPRLQMKSNKIMDFDELQLSGIHKGEQDNGCEQFISYINLQQANGKLQSLKKLLTAPQLKNQTMQLNYIRQVLNIQQKNQLQILNISHSQQSEQQDEERQSIPSCLQPLAETLTMQQAINKLKNKSLQQDKAKLNFIRQHNLSKIIDDCYKMNTPHQLCEAILQKILQLIEQSAHYMQIIQYLSSERVVSFLQHIYLSHQTNADIIETATLVLSRIKLKDFQLELTNQFTKALQIRLKVESKGSFLYGNIHFILN